MSDAVLSVEIRAKMAELSKGLKVAEDGIDNFVLRGNDSLGIIEQQFKSLGKTSREIAANMNAAFKNVSFKDVATGAVGTQNAINGYKEALSKSRAEIVALKAEQQRLKTEFEGTKAAAQGQKLALEQGRVATQSYRTESARLAAELQRLRLEKAQNQKATIAASGSYDQMRTRMTALGREIRAAGGGMDANNKKVQAMVSEYNRLNTALKQFDASMGNHQRNVGNYKSAMGGMGNEIRSLAAAYLSFQAVIQGVGRTFDTALRLDSVSTALGHIFKDTDAADRKMDDLAKTADRLGLEFLPLTNSYKAFIGTAIASNFNLEEAEKIFMAVSSASAKLRLSTDDTDGALRALYQMISKGNVQAEELRGQLGERLPGAFAIAARAMNVTESELNDMLKKGEVLAADLLPKLRVELENTFDLDHAERIDGLAASWNRFKNTFTTAVEDASNLDKFFQVFIDGLNDIASNITGMVNSKSWSEFWTRMFVSKEAGDQVRGIQDVYKDGYKTLNQFARISGKSNDELVKGYRSVTEQLKAVNDQVKIYKDAIASGDMVDGGDVQLKKLEQLADSLAGKKFQMELVVPKDILNPKTPSFTPAGSGKKEVDKIAQAYDNLSTKMKQISADHTLTFGKKAEQEVSAYKGAINSLIAAGVDPLDARIKQLQNSISTASILNGKGIQAKLVGVGEFTDGVEKYTGGVDKIVTSVKMVDPAMMGMTNAMLFAQIQFDQIKSRLVAASEELTQGFQNSVAGLGSDIAESLGAAFAGNEDFGQGLLKSIGSFLSQLGGLFMKYAMAAGLFAKLQIALTNPVTAIPAAAALFAAGLALKGVGAAITSSAQSGSIQESGSSSAVKPIPRFANGGIVSGPTLGLMGEYSGAASNPEVIAPLDRLTNMIRQAVAMPMISALSGSVGTSPMTASAMGSARQLGSTRPITIEVTGEFVQRQGDLVAVVEQGQKKNKRMF